MVSKYIKALKNQHQALGVVLHNARVRKEWKAVFESAIDFEQRGCLYDDKTLFTILAGLKARQYPAPDITVGEDGWTIEFYHMSEDIQISRQYWREKVPGPLIAMAFDRFDDDVDSKPLTDITDVFRYLEPFKADLC